MKIFGWQFYDGVRIFGWQLYAGVRICGWQFYGRVRIFGWQNDGRVRRGPRGELFYVNFKVRSLWGFSYVRKAKHFNLASVLCESDPSHFIDVPLMTALFKLLFLSIFFKI